MFFASCPPMKQPFTSLETLLPWGSRALGDVASPRQERTRMWVELLNENTWVLSLLQLPCLGHQQ